MDEVRLPDEQFAVALSTLPLLAEILACVESVYCGLADIEYRGRGESFRCERRRATGAAV